MNGPSLRCNPAFNRKPFWPTCAKASSSSQPPENVAHPFLHFPLLAPVRHLHYYDEMQISLKDTSVPFGPPQPFRPYRLHFNMCAICPSISWQPHPHGFALRFPATPLPCLLSLLFFPTFPSFGVSVCYSYANYISCV